MKKFLLLTAVLTLFTLTAAEEKAGKNLALSCAVFCSDGTNPEYAVDGNRKGNFYEGAWSPKNFLEVDLGTVREVDGIRVFFWCGDGRYYQYYVTGSVDGKKWFGIMDRRKNTSVSSPAGDGQDFKPRNMRFVRIHTVFNSVNAAVHVRELEIYGK